MLGDCRLRLLRLFFLGFATQTDRTATTLEESSSPHMKRTSSSISSQYPSRLLRTSSVFNENSNQEIVTNEDYDPIFTKDILFFIFTMLSRKDLTNARRVCKKWKTIADDPYFGWNQVAVVTGSLVDPSEYDPKENYRVVTEGQEFFLETDTGKRMKQPYRPYFQTKASVIEYAESQPKLWRLFVTHKKDSKNVIKVIAEVHVPELERLFAADEDIEGADMIENVILHEDTEVAYKKIREVPISHKRPHIPMVIDTPAPQPEGFSISLKKYQLDAVAWMKSLELRIRDKEPFKCATVVPWRSARCDLVVDLEVEAPSNRFVAFEDIKDHCKLIYPKGGIFGDEIGLGKTMALIALIVSNPSPAVSELEDKERDPNDEGQKILEDEKFSKKQFKSRATLVLCPNHLAAQWQSEIQKNVQLPLKVLVITTITQLSKYSYKDIMEADVVIASFQLLKNPKYFRIGDNETAAPRVGEEKKRHAWVKSTLDKIRKTSKPENHKGPALFEHFYWYRLIIDEAHEVMDTFYKTTLELYDYKYFWYVSGTPFPNELIVADVMKLLNFPSFKIGKNGKDGRNFSLQWLQIDILLNNMYWRNTKESVKNEYEIPAWVEELIALDFTDVEMALYHDYWGLRERQAARQLCSQIPSIEGAATLNEIRLVVIEKKKEGLESYRKYKKELAELKSKMKQTTNNFRKTALKEDVENLTDKTNQLAANLHQHATTLKSLIQSNSFESRFARVCEALKWSVPKSYSKAIEEITKFETEMLKNNSKLLDLSSVKIIEQGPKEGKQTPKGQYGSDDDDDDKDPPAKLSKQFIIKSSWNRAKNELRKRGYIADRKASKTELKNKLYEFMEKENATKEVKKKKTKKRKQEDEDSEEESNNNNNKKKKRGRDTSDSEDENDRPSKIQKYDFTRKRTDVELLEELLNLVEQYGTKMGNLVYYLRRLFEHTPDARVILFSQFDEVLKEVGELLANNDIKSTFVQGNVMKKNKAIKSFRDTDAVKVIMLSLEKAASGTNLIEASHVILMDPISGSAEEAKAIESQAIGRAYRQGQSKQITVVRFVIRGTVEHKGYVQNYLQNDQSLFIARQKDMGPLHKAISQVNNPKGEEKLSRHSLTKSSSISNILVSSTLNSKGDVAALVEQTNDAAVAKEFTFNNNNDDKGEEEMDGMVSESEDE